MDDTPSLDSDEYKAAHEAGHAILAWVSPHVVHIAFVTIVPAGNSVGGVQATSLYSLPDWDEITQALAGMAATDHAFGILGTQGEQADLTKARTHAEALAATCGDAMPTPPWSTPDIAATVDVGTLFRERPSDISCAILNAGYRHAKAVIASRPDAFRALAALLRVRLTLDEQDVESVLGPRPWAPYRARR